jgi:hypothetical protein
MSPKLSVLCWGSATVALIALSGILKAITELPTAAILGIILPLECFTGLLTGFNLYEWWKEGK